MVDAKGVFDPILKNGFNLTLRFKCFLATIEKKKKVQNFFPFSKLRSVYAKYHVQGIQLCNTLFSFQRTSTFIVAPLLKIRYVDDTRTNGSSNGRTRY